MDRTDAEDDKENEAVKPPPPPSVLPAVEVVGMEGVGMEWQLEKLQAHLSEEEKRFISEYGEGALQLLI